MRSVRTTLALDADVAAKARAEARRSGEPFKSVINNALRQGLKTKAVVAARKFKIKAKPLGVFPHLNYDKISELLEYAEGPLHR